MDDDSDQESDDSGDEMLFPMSAATSMVAMDGEEGENAPTDGITTTGVWVGATAIRSTHRCRWFLFYCCCCFVLFDCCVSLLFSFHP